MTTSDVGAGDDASTCGVGTNDAPGIKTTNIPTVAPAMVGGSIAVGTYYATAHNIYTGIGGASGQASALEYDTLAFTSSAFNEAVAIVVNDAGALSQSTASGTYSVAGSTITFDVDCPPPPVVGYPTTYSADGGTLTLQEVGSGFTDEHVYTRQL